MHYRKSGIGKRTQNSLRKINGMEKYIDEDKSFFANIWSHFFLDFFRLNSSFQSQSLQQIDEQKRRKKNEMFLESNWNHNTHSVGGKKNWANIDWILRDSLVHMYTQFSLKHFHSCRTFSIFDFPKSFSRLNGINREDFVSRLSSMERTLLMFQKFYYKSVWRADECENFCLRSEIHAHDALNA